MTGPATRAPSVTAPPIARAAASPTARVSVATAVITSIRIPVNTASMAIAAGTGTDGDVTPIGTSPSAHRRVAAAAIAPATWAIPYVTTRGHGKWRPRANADRHGRVEVRARDVAERIDHHRDREAERDGDPGGVEPADRDRPAAGEDEDERSDELGDVRPHASDTAGGRPAARSAISMNGRRRVATSIRVRRKASSFSWSVPSTSDGSSRPQWSEFI